LSEHTQSAIGFGQGISVTPLQLACAYSAIANGGLLMRPYFVKKIIDSKGMTVQENVPFIRHRVVSEKTALTVKKILKSVVRKGGTGEKAAVAGFTVAGKTGTSQKIENNKERYSSKKTVASFVGFAPADSPRITILVIIDEPQRMTYGGEIAAPTFSRMSRLILNYLHVAPDSTLQKIYKEWQETKIISSRDEELG
jgi:cell division protein FtsI (penicillin-binding protein 3)